MASRKRRAKLATKITIAVAVALLAGLGVQTAVTGYEASNSIEAQVRSEQAAAAERLAGRMDGDLESAHRALMTEAVLVPDDELVPEPDEDKLRARFAPLVAGGMFQAVALFDASGATLFATNQDIQPPLASGLVFNDGAPTWAVALPARDPTILLVGVQSAAVVVDALFTEVPSNAEAALVAADGSVVASTTGSTDVHAIASGLVDPVEVRAALVEGHEVVMYGSTAAATALRNQVLLTTAATGAALLLGAVALGAVLARQIAAPLKDVAATAKRIESGELDARVPASKTEEMDQLASSINDMAAALQKDRASLLQLQRSLEDRVQERTEEVRRGRDEMERFFYGVGHDIKGPVIGINSLLQILDESLESEPMERQRVILKQALRSGRGLEELIADLMRFARADKETIAAERHNVGAILRAAVEPLRPSTLEHNVVVRVARVRIEADVDGRVVTRIIQNLVRNAILHSSGPRRRVRVDAVARGGDLEIHVADNGKGIPEHLQANMFRPFSRGNAGGTGLGLSIVHRLAAAHGGSVRFDTGPTGTTMVARFPDVRARESPRRSRAKV